MLAKLDSSSMAELRSEWRRVYRAPPPVVYTSDLLVRGIAYRLQERQFGGLAREARLELEELAGIDGKQKRAGAEAQARRLRPGSRLVRRWRGVTYIVAVTETGFVFEDRPYDSLSEIAREITGTRWSGPRFFGCGPSR